MRKLVMLALAACLAVSGLANAQPTTSFTDNRPQERRESRRDSVFAPTIVLGDNALEPSAIARFQSTLVAQFTELESLDIVVEDFALIDYFPRRLRGAMAGVSGALTGPIAQDLIDSHTDWAEVERLSLPTNGEAIICLFSGTINGRRVQLATVAEYSTPATAFVIRRTRQFRTAVTDAIDAAAVSAAGQYNKTDNTSAPPPDDTSASPVD